MVVHVVVILVVVIVITVVLISVIIIVEITPHSARNASKQGWLLRNKTGHRRLTQHLAWCTAASLDMLPLSCRATPFASHHPSLVALCLSCHALPLLSPFASLVMLCFTVD